MTQRLTKMTAESVQLAAMQEFESRAERKRKEPQFFADVPADFAQALFDLAGHNDFRFTIGLKKPVLFAVSQRDAVVYRLHIEIRKDSGWPVWKEVEL